MVSLKLREQSFKEKTVRSVKWETNNTSGSVYVGRGIEEETPQLELWR